MSLKISISIVLSAVAITISGVVFFSNQQLKRKMIGEKTVFDKNVEVNGIKFHYREWGDAEAPPLLILHGLTGHAWEFDSVACSLSDQFYVIVLNQRGHGASSWADEYSPAIMAGDIAAFIDVLGLGSVTLVGHSMGAVNGWWFASQYPDKTERLVILDIEPGVVASENIVAGWIDALGDYAIDHFDDQEEAVEHYLSGYSGLHSEELRKFVLNNLKKDDTDNRWKWKFDASGLQNWMINASRAKEELWNNLKLVSCPTLIVAASDSPFTNIEAMKQMVREIPNSKLVVISDTGHDIHIDQRDALLRELKFFLLAE